MTNKKNILAIFAALTAQIIFGFSFMFTKIALQTASPLVVIANRYMVAFILLGIWFLVKKIKMNLRKNIFTLILMSVFQPCLYFIFESYGIKLTSSSFSSVMIALIPVVSMLCGIFTLKEVPTPIQFVFMTLSVIGVATITLQGKSDGTVTAFGVLLLAGAVIASVGYNILSRKLSSEFSVFERTFVMTASGLVFFTITAFFENVNNPVVIIAAFSKSSYVYSILYLSVLSSVVAFLLLNFSHTYLPVAKTTAFSNITTVVSVIAGVVFLNEPFGVVSWIATLMIVAGVCGVQLIDVKNK